LLADSASLAADDDKRRAFVAKAEALLTGKVLAHNHYLARRADCRMGRILADPDMIEDQCAKLAAFCRIETRPCAKPFRWPTSWCTAAACLQQPFAAIRRPK
jgi:hypothetical protein